MHRFLDSKLGVPVAFWGAPEFSKIHGILWTSKNKIKTFLKNRIHAAPKQNALRNNGG